MRVAITEEVMNVREAPIGLLQLEDGGEVILKTEYSDEKGCECYIVSSGERYWGKGDKALCKALVLI